MEIKKLMEELEIDVIPPYMIKSKVSIITECQFFASIIYVHYVQWTIIKL